MHNQILCARRLYHQKAPDSAEIVANSFLKGAVLGLGILNILIGVQEIVKLLKSFKRQLPG
jgi:hypothetical protein